MFYYLSQKILDWAARNGWAEQFSPLRLFRYITFRTAGAAITALLLSWWLGPKVIRWLKQLKFGQEYADKAESAGTLAARLLSKKGTPTMGGLLIILALNLTTLLWTEWNTLIQLSLLSVVVLTALDWRHADFASHDEGKAVFHSESHWLSRQALSDDQASHDAAGCRSGSTYRRQ